MPPPTAGKRLQDKKAAASSSSSSKAAEERIITEDEKVVLQRQIEALKLQLARESEKSLTAEQSVRDLRTRLVQLQHDFTLEKQHTKDLAIDMTRQYKSMREDLLQQLAAAQTALQIEHEEHKKQTLAFVQTKQQLTQIIAEKEAQIQVEKQKIGEMTAEFAAMLQSTLDKMNERMEVTNEWEGTHKDEPVIRTFEEFELGQASP